MKTAPIVASLVLPALIPALAAGAFPRPARAAECRPPLRSQGGAPGEPRPLPPGASPALAGWYANPASAPIRLRMGTEPQQGQAVIRFLLGEGALTQAEVDEGMYLMVDHLISDFVVLRDPAGLDRLLAAAGGRIVSVEPWDAVPGAPTVPPAAPPAARPAPIADAVAPPLWLMQAHLALGSPELKRWFNRGEGSGPRLAFNLAPLRDAGKIVDYLEQKSLITDKQARIYRAVIEQMPGWMPQIRVELAPEDVRDLFDALPGTVKELQAIPAEPTPLRG